MILLQLHYYIGWKKNSAEWARRAKIRLCLAFGYPKAYKGTLRGEFCS